MKTPEEIKKGIRKCFGFHAECEDVCELCPYWSEGPFCRGALCHDAIAYIDQLEKHTSLNDLRDAIYKDAVAHGLWDDDEDYMPTDCVYFIKDEVCELDCAAMDWEDDVCNDNSAFCDELSDVIIMCLSVSGYLGIDIDAAVRRKMEINRARTWKHGKGEQ